MRYGIKTSPQHTEWADMLAVWQAADEIDVFESAWNFDHFYPIFSDSTGPCLEGWTMLAAMAQATRRLRVGVQVSAMPYRHPAVLANMAATIDIISGGRLDLGLGAGWNDEEADAYGIELPPLRTRFDRFDEGVEAIVMLLTQETSSFDGEWVRLTDARCEPKACSVRTRPSPSAATGGRAPCARSPAGRSTGTASAARRRSGGSCATSSTATAPTSDGTRERSSPR
jgi:alkanesulfonate monooxygenase SsuD/methylene tetrahydromethanopterin reductase-like flavin-dependent oxidoreductase (luciferase family)